MAYSTKELEKEILKVIEDNNLMFFDDIQAYVEPSNKTLYNHKLQELQTIKSALAINKIKTKIGLKKKWRESDNPTLQIALYKLIGEKEEYMALANARQEMNIPGIEKIGEIVLTSVKKNGKKSRDKGN